VDGQILCRYLAEVVLPRQLTIYYAAPESVDATMVILAWATLLALVCASLWPARTRALVAFSWLFAAAALAPALNLVPQLAPCADHYVLWSLPELLLLIVVLVDDLLVRLPAADHRLPWLLGGGLALYLGLLSLARLPEFASRLELFRSAVRHQPDCGINWAHFITYELERGGDLTQAEHAAVRALQCGDSGRILAEDRALVIVLAALAAYHQGKPGAATALIEREVARLPEDGGVIADIVRAQFAMRSGDPARAVVLLQRFYPPPLREAAATLRARCRSGAELPDAQPSLIGVTANRAVLADSVDLGHGLDNQERQLQSLAYAYEMSGDLEQAFDVAALALNLAPYNREARQLLIAIDRRLHLDAAAERLMADATDVPLAPSR
jgi:tetratricopeptide (TPR) repeat protein